MLISISRGIMDEALLTDLFEKLCKTVLCCAIFLFILLVLGGIFVKFYDIGKMFEKRKKKLDGQPLDIKKPHKGYGLEPKTTKQFVKNASGPNSGTTGLPTRVNP